MENPIESVQFPKKERDVLELLRQKVSIKDIGALLEISANTVRERLRASCARAQVVDETEMTLFLIQNPRILVQGATCSPGLHIPIMRDTTEEPDDEIREVCECGKPDCLGWVAMKLKRA